MISKFNSMLMLLFLFYSGLISADDVLAVNIKRLAVESGMKIAKTAMLKCRDKGIHVGVVIIDRGGNEQVVLRDTLTSDMTVIIAKQKAYSSLSFNAATSSLGWQSKSPLVNLDGLMLIGGGVPIQAGGEIFGAIGVSGAPTAEVDEECALAGISAIIDDLDMED